MKTELRKFFAAYESYHKVMEMAAAKYYRYGHFTGTIPLTTFTEKEQVEIADFLGVASSEFLQKKKLTLKAWQKAYEESRFHQIAFEEAVELVTGQKLRTKGFEQAQKEAERKQYVDYFSECEGLEFVSPKRQLDFLRQQVSRTELDLLAQLIQALPKELTYLPVYAQQQLGNPHGLDRQMRIGKLFFTLLTDLSQLTRETNESATEYRSRIYQQQNLVVDDLMNFVTISNLVAKTKEGIDHPMWQGACEYQVIWNVPIKALLDIETVRPRQGNTVFIFENSSLYSALLTAFPALPSICHQGQFRLAMWRILALFPETTHFFYASDMDPEGLQMADKIKQRYQERVQFLFMDQQSYLSYPSEKDVSNSLPKLTSLIDPNLKAIAESMKEKKVASYQESLYEKYVAFLSKWEKSGNI